ncbi:hypothetical protein ACIPC1_34340 [Streptomyces sp. NPDC087263]|uniref:hypothetical protein n=1 Tax=Streptomyces sp. NPDC087263 TaxID=3365773 RepID=UPI003810CA61
MTFNGDADQEKLDAVQGVPVGRTSFVRIRMFSQTHRKQQQLNTPPGTPRRSH